MSRIDDRLTVSGRYDDTSGGGWFSDSDSLLPTEEADRRSYPWDSSPEPQEVLRGHRGEDEGNPLRLGQATPPGTKSLGSTDGTYSTADALDVFREAMDENRLARQAKPSQQAIDTPALRTGMLTAPPPGRESGAKFLKTPIYEGEQRQQLEGWGQAFYNIGATAPVLIDLLDTLNEKWTLPPADKALLQEIVDKIKRRKVGHTLLPIAKNAIEAELQKGPLTVSEAAAAAGCSHDHARKCIKDLGCREVGKKGKEKIWALPVEAGE